MDSIQYLAALGCGQDSYPAIWKPFLCVDDEWGSQYDIAQKCGLDNQYVLVFGITLVYFIFSLLRFSSPMSLRISGRHGRQRRRI